MLSFFKFSHFQSLSFLTKKIRSEEDESESQEKPTDQYWYQYFNMPDITGENCKYPIVSKLIEAAMLASHGNADVDILMLTWDTASMSERTLNTSIAEVCTQGIQ